MMSFSTRLSTGGTAKFEKKFRLIAVKLRKRTHAACIQGGRYFAGVAGPSPAAFCFADDP
jgi:hypothetical protein